MTDSQTIRAGIYARVSSEQQAQQKTIESQMSDLKERVGQDGLVVDEELSFVDDGCSGSTLVRPALERLRDVAYAGGLDRLYVHSPDRLARKYAYQVLLVDELTHCGRSWCFSTMLWEPVRKKISYFKCKAKELVAKRMLGGYGRAKKRPLVAGFQALSDSVDP